VTNIDGHKVYNMDMISVSINQWFIEYFGIRCWMTQLFRSYSLEHTSFFNCNSE